MGDSPRSQISANIVFAVVKSISVLVSIRLADTLLTAQIMGLLLLVRRQGSLWSTLVQLGFSQSVQKFYIAEKTESERLEQWGTMVRWVSAASLLTIALCVLFGNDIGYFLFASRDPRLAWGFGIYVSGLALGYMANSSWQAEFRFTQSNAIDWVNGSLLFILCLIWGHSLSGPSFITTLAGLTLAASACSLWLFTRKINGNEALFKGGWKLNRNITHYSVTRALTAFADMATMVLGPWLLRSQPEQAGYLIVALIVVRVAQTMVLPVARVLALRANSYRYDRMQEERLVLWFAGIVFSGSCLLVVLYFWKAGPILEWWLPNSYLFVTSIVDKLIFFLPGIGVFYSARNYVEFRYSYPFNLAFLSCSIMIFLAAHFIQGPATLDAITNSMACMFATFYVYSFLAVTKLVSSVR